MQAGDVITEAEVDYIEQLETLALMVSMGNTEIETLAILARKICAVGVKLHQD